jgi:glycosyltransferase involved in cell wall biosynthesis
MTHYMKSAIGYFSEYCYFTITCLFLSIYVLIKDGFDVIHIHNPPDTLILVGVFYRLFGKKIVFDHHDLSPELYLSRFGTDGGYVYRGLILLEKICLTVANVALATNESYRQIEIERAKISPEKIFVVRNGPDLSWVKPVPKDRRLAELDKTILCYLGVMNPQDGVDYLLKAIQILVYEMRRRDFFCVLIGTGDSLQDLKVMSRELRIKDFVWFTGFVTNEDMLRYLSTADICLDPDPSSPLNNVSTWIKVMMYMALGKPIVAFDLKETRYTAQESALYALPNDVEAFARAIVKLMDDPETCSRMGEFGLNRIRTELAWQHVSRHLIYAYQSLWSQKWHGWQQI